jgi:hypothetical protein
MWLLGITYTRRSAECQKVLAWKSLMAEVVLSLVF